MMNIFKRKRQILTFASITIQQQTQHPIKMTTTEINLLTYSNSTVTSIKYCDLNDFAKVYREIHGYLSLLVCILGSIANILNICVLTTREMRWPTNYILTGLAVADLLVMLEYIPFASHVYLYDTKSRQSLDYFTYSWAVYTIFHALFTQICHFISCCLTVILAVWRSIAITHPQNNWLWCTVTNVRSTMFAIAFTYIFCPLVCIPLFLSLNVIARARVADERNMLIHPKLLKNFTGATHNGTVYTAELSGDYKDVSLWVYGVVIKLVPCILLTVLSMRLIIALVETKKRRRYLLNSSGMPLIEANGKTSTTHKRHLEKEQQTDRTTRMLLAVLLLFLITEFPQAILGLLSGTIGDIFIQQCYSPLGDLIDIVALVNSGINFILYCSMSRQFRSAFKEVFRPKLLNRWLPLPQKQQPHPVTEHNGGMTQVTQV